MDAGLTEFQSLLEPSLSPSSRPTTSTGAPPGGTSPADRAEQGRDHVWLEAGPDAEAGA
jgi:hypothetical protein